MKTLKHILSTFIAAAMFAGCTEEIEYTPGVSEDPDCYGVYFPTQTSPTTVELSSTEKKEVTYKVRRSRYTDAITVPVNITVNKEDVLEIAPITFGPGEQETTFTVEFPNAEKGVEYTCDIRIEDPHYISVYGTRSTSLSFSVLVADWVPVTGADGSTKGKWRDDILGNLYSLNSSSFNPNPEIEVEIYEREDIKGYYRMKVYGASLVKSFVGGGNVSYTSEDLWTIVDASDPEKVYIPYQSTGLTLVQNDGAIAIGSSVPENVSMDESAGQYGKLEDGIITFPAQSILIKIESMGDLAVYGNINGMQRIVLPGVKIPDYSVTLSKTEPKDGVVNIGVKFATTDSKTMRYSIFEGSLDSGQASLEAQDMDAAKDEEGTFTGSVENTGENGSGTIKVEGMKTGKYTLVGCIYDSEGIMRDYASIPFGYVATGEEKNVKLTWALEKTNEYAGQGISTENALKFWAWNADPDSDIESLTYGLFRTKRLEGKDLNSILDASGTKLTAEELEELNSGHFSKMITELNGNSDYTLLLRASNGYITKIDRQAQKTDGTFDPGMEVFYYEDFLSDQPTADELVGTKWKYYAVNLMDTDAVRKEIGTVTMSKSSQSVSGGTDLDITGMSGVEFDEGGALIGAYIPGNSNSSISDYKGALGLYVNQAITNGIYKGNENILGFALSDLSNVYIQGVCMLMGEVADGYLYCVSSPDAEQQLGIPFEYLFTGPSDGSGITSLMSEMMLVDPAKEVSKELSSAALKRIAQLRRQAVERFKREPRNYVELPFQGLSGDCSSEAPALNLAVSLKPASAPAPRRAEAVTSFIPASGNGRDTGAAELEMIGIPVGKVL